MPTRADLIAGALIFIFTCTIFLISRVHQVADSHYSMLVSESLLHHGSFALDQYALPRLEPKQRGDYVSNGDIYQLELIKGRIYYFLPPGSSVLSVPYVAVMNLFGVSASSTDGTYNRLGEVKIEASLAALLMALLAVVIYATSRLLLPTGWSVLIVLGSALGTQIWSTASRALWSETWGIFLLGFVIWMLLAQETVRHRLRPVMLASLLAWAYFVRPTFSIPIAAITIYLFIYYRPMFLKYAATGACWFVLFIAYSWFNFGQLLPSYYHASRLSFDTFWIALAGNLVSPGRGLLVFVPILIFLGYLLIRYARELPSPRLTLLCLAIIVIHLIVISGFPHWWGGHSFGPRFSTGLAPWFSLLGILAIKAWLTWGDQKRVEKSRWTHKLEVTLGSLLLLCSLVINALGATAHRTWLWNIRPLEIDQHPERLWDWKNPQFYANKS